MNCPVCNRNNAFNLSICPSCGAMMNDTVRAELSPKISISKPLPRIEPKETVASGKLIQPSAVVKDEPNRATIAAPLSSKIMEQKQTTGNLTVKTTSPTLVEFHSKKSTVPEWRVQLQNAVRQRQDRDNRQTENFSAPVAAATAVVSAARKTKFATSGANALKIEIAPEKLPAARSKNPTLNSALERIEKSRRKFFVEEEEEEMQTPTAPAAAAPRPASKNFPFYIASKQTEIGEKKEESKTATQTAAPKIIADGDAASLGNKSGDLDTNKLPPLSSVINQSTLQSIPAPAKVSTNFAKTAPSAAPLTETEIEIKSVENKETTTPEAEVQQHEQTDDFAPFALRFNAGLFDLIIGSFLSLLLLAPFILTASGETSWLSLTGVLAFLATCSIVMFIYLTTTVGFYGRTFGMRIFSLEVVDIEGENYPTLHQAAVSSAVYLLSLACCGAGFLTLLFNEERRAAHDLASGTIVVKEA